MPAALMGSNTASLNELKPMTITNTSFRLPHTCIVGVGVVLYVVPEGGWRTKDVVSDAKRQMQDRCAGVRLGRALWDDVSSLPHRTPLIYSLDLSPSLF